MRCEAPFDSDQIPSEGGAYVLELALDRAAVAEVGRLGPVRLESGRVRYYGSAYGPGGLRGRLARPLDPPHRAKHWHVDWLLGQAVVVAIEVEPGARECDLVARDREGGEWEAAIARFGSSDCARCAAHLMVERPPKGARGTPLPSVTRHLSERAATSGRPGWALDIACGRGRHLAALLEHGWRAVGVDHDPEALALAAEAAPGAELIEWDVEAVGLPPGLSDRFDLVLTTFFLYRPLIPALRATMRPGAEWLLETFHSRNRTLHGRPRRRAFCLGWGEAARLAREAGLEPLWCNEGEHGGLWTTQMVAQRERSSVAKVSP